MMIHTKIIEHITMFSNTELFPAKTLPNSATMKQITVNINSKTSFLFILFSFRLARE